ncbi:MAG: S-layer homology domain-containing protein [Acidimicrobiaceae bacterium]|nr:S-layer homology domain-containing protein [Acidimicrobiaceae bacterium]
MRKFAYTVVTATVVLVLAAAGTVAAQNSLRFSDVPTDHKAYDAIEWAAVNGVAGCGDGRFCPDEAVTRAEVATMMYQRIRAQFSGVGDGATDDITLEPGYYSVSVAFFPKSGYDWDDDKEHDFYARFESKSDGLTLVDGDWGGAWPAEVENPDKVSNKHSDVHRWQHFRVDETAVHWFDIKTSGKIAWVAEITRRASQPGRAGWQTDDSD